MANPISSNVLASKFLKCTVPPLPPNHKFFYSFWQQNIFNLPASPNTGVDLGLVSSLVCNKTLPCMKQAVLFACKCRCRTEFFQGIRISFIPSFQLRRTPWKIHWSCEVSVFYFYYVVKEFSAYPQINFQPNPFVWTEMCQKSVPPCFQVVFPFDTSSSKRLALSS